MTVRELRIELRRRDESATGRKAELVRRLQNLVEEEGEEPSSEERRPRRATRENRNDVENAILQISMCAHDLPSVIGSRIAQFARPAIPYSNTLSILKQLHQCAKGSIDAAEDSDFEYLDDDDMEALIPSVSLDIQTEFKIPTHQLKKYVTVIHEQDEYMTIEEKDLETRLTDAEGSRGRKRRKTRHIKNELERDTTLSGTVTLTITNSRRSAEYYDPCFDMEMEDALHRDGPFYLVVRFNRRDKRVFPDHLKKDVPEYSGLKKLPIFSRYRMNCTFHRIIAKFKRIDDLMEDTTLIKKTHEAIIEALAHVKRCSKEACLSLVKEKVTHMSHASKREWTYEVFCGRQTGGAAKCIECNVQAFFDP